MFCCCYFLSFYSFLLFNDRLDERDLRTYQTDLHEIFRIGRCVVVAVQSGIRFTIAERTLPWQPILGTKSAEIGETPSFLGLTFHNRWQHGKAEGRINTSDILSTSVKNLVNFGPLTPEFAMLIWQPFQGQIGEIQVTVSQQWFDRSLQNLAQ